MSRPRLSFESISVQDGTLLKHLTEAMTELRKDGSFTTAAIEKADIPGIVRMHTNMRVLFIIDPNAGKNAFITWPNIDKNHPFVNELYKNFNNSETGLALIRAMGGSVKGSVDLVRSKVSGIYEHIQGDITFGKDLMADKKFTDGELASILLHEIGHLHTYFEYIGTTVLDAHVLSAAVKATNEVQSTEERVVVLKEAQRVLGVDIDNVERLALLPAAVRSVTTQTIFVSAMSKKTRSATGKNIYELRNVEQLADQFCQRHGGGADLVTGLDKLLRGYMHASTLTTTEHTLIEAIKLILFLARTFFFPLTIIPFLLFSNPTRKIYDSPEARVKLMRQMITEELKKRNLPDAKRKQLLDDIEAVKEVEAGLDDKRTLLELFWTEIMPPGREAAKQEAVMKALESLSNNELFVHAAKFQDIK